MWQIYDEKWTIKANLERNANGEQCERNIAGKEKRQGRGKGKGMRLNFKARQKETEMIDEGKAEEKRRKIEMDINWKELRKTEEWKRMVRQICVKKDKR